MAVSDVQGAPTSADRLKSAAAPIAAGVLGIVAAIIGGTVLSAPGNDAPSTMGGPLEASNPSSPGPAPGAALPGVQFDQTPSGAPNMGMEIVVKLKDDSKVKEIIDAFWRDQPSGRAKFEAWKTGRPEFAELKLDRVTYSNELVLVHQSATAADRRLPVMREIAKKLGALADVSYAEPNMTAQPGGR
jgi:hypothetical protein